MHRQDMPGLLALGSLSPTAYMAGLLLFCCLSLLCVPSEKKHLWLSMREAPSTVDFPFLWLLWCCQSNPVPFAALLRPAVAGWGSRPGGVASVCWRDWVPALSCSSWFWHMCLYFPSSGVFWYSLRLCLCLAGRTVARKNELPILPLHKVFILAPCQ